jgi:solute carrier family 25 (mitochondrial dicarboxylate transporter), member 10
MFAGVMGGIAGTPADITNIRMQADTQLPLDQRRNYRHAFHGLSVITKSMSRFREQAPSSD